MNATTERLVTLLDLCNWKMKQAIMIIMMIIIIPYYCDDPGVNEHRCGTIMVPC